MSALSDTSFRLELGLTVTHIEVAVGFYTTLFGTPPVRQLPGFARFEVDDPPVALALSVGTSATGGTLNHVGFRVEDADRLLAVQQRLEQAGIDTDREDNVECCYSHQTKFWVADPDGNSWEVYRLEDESAESDDDDRESAAPPVVWGNRRDEPLSLPLPLDDASVDEIHLVDPERHRDQLCAVLRDAARALRSGGALSLQMSTHSPDALPELCSAVEAAGFYGTQVEHIRFSNGGTGSTKWDVALSAIKPQPGGEEGPYVILYRGPAAEIELTDGLRLPRGQRVTVDRAVWELCRSAGISSAFTAFPQ
ncbi:MAG TPA: ArsI/CadI family heavy metal resistance metalloenzyme [Planctomycetaceae bacterium]|nr:ArsI/CadI family heavy metal resistance metalloenzyme [Planctomycetaceae bacterium]